MQQSSPSRIVRADPGRLAFIRASQAETALISFGRPLTEGEASALLARLTAALSAPGSAVSILEVGGQPGGYFWLEERGRGQAFLLDIFVAPAVRRRGLGALLLDRALLEAARRGAAEMRLAVAEENGRALTLFRSRGFVAGDVELREGRRWLELATRRLPAPP